MKLMAAGTETLQTGASKPSGRRFRVALLIDTLATKGGSERQVEETVLRMDHTRFEVHVVCLEDSPRLRRLEGIAKVAVFPMDSVFRPGSIPEILRFRRYLRDQQIDLLQSFMVKTAFFGAFGGMWGACPVVITSRLNIGHWYTPSLLRAYRAINRVTTRVFANSEAAKQIAVDREGLDPAIVDVVYQGVDMDAFSNANASPAAIEWLKIPAGVRVVGITANLRPVKDHDLFLRAAAIVARRVPDSAFLLIGRGELREELDRLADSLGLGGRVFFTNGEGRVVDYLARCSIACLTSKGEGFSNAILEYMAMGLPVVATNVGGNPEAVLDGDTGFIVSERTPEALAAPLIRLLEDEAGRAAMGRRGYERCREEFEINHTIRVLEQYFERQIVAAGRA
jgi:glycosyltransferase involved in cell wall biosynthesis